jgi:hypothetical protein
MELEAKLREVEERMTVKWNREAIYREVVKAKKAFVDGRQM